jgi:dTMP kinase
LGIVFAAMFVGLALGMSVGVRFLHGFSKRRLFGLAIAVASIPLALLGLIPNLPVVIFLVVVLGILAGMAYVTAYTVVGQEVDDDTRGRTFAFLQSALRVVMFGVIALSGLAAGAITSVVGSLRSGQNEVHVGTITYGAVGNNVVLLLAAVVAAVLGYRSYRQMDDRPGAPLLPDLAASIRGKPLPPRPRAARQRALQGRGGVPHTDDDSGPPAPRRAGCVRGRRRCGQVNAGQAAGDLAAGERLRRAGDARARSYQDRHAAAGAAARHGSHRPVAVGRGDDVRGRPRRARGERDPAGDREGNGRRH